MRISDWSSDVCSSDLRARRIVAERGTPEQVAQCDDLWAGRLDSVEKLRRYYEVMGPLYSRKYDPAAAAARLDRPILSPDAINLAFAPGGFLRTFDLRPEPPRRPPPTPTLPARHAH